MLLPDVILTHLNYTAWASTRLVEAAAALSEEELTRDFGTADKSVLGTLVHVLAADRIWHSRVIGAPRTTFIDPEDYSLKVLQTEWPVVHEKWAGYAAGITPESAAQVIEFKDLRGNPHRQPLWQILLHMVNHGTHHRGQAVGFLRTMGHKPPALDLIFYYRSIA
ncbi:MAG: DUF664 domain-containing protein [Acidobacteria bacterium]|nr:DUF664 domain-containing protein [Acidobacteriota bacterium]